MLREDRPGTGAILMAVITPVLILIGIEFPELIGVVVLTVAAIAGLATLLFGPNIQRGGGDA